MNAPSARGGPPLSAEAARALSMVRGRGSRGIVVRHGVCVVHLSTVEDAAQFSEKVRPLAAVVKLWAGRGSVAAQCQVCAQMQQHKGILHSTGAALKPGKKATSEDVRTALVQRGCKKLAKEWEAERARRRVNAHRDGRLEQRVLAVLSPSTIPEQASDGTVDD